MSQQNRTTTEITEIDTALSTMRRQQYVVPIKMDIAFLKPLAAWYEWMTLEQKKNLPPRVLNALDSVNEIFKGRI